MSVHTPTVHGRRTVCVPACSGTMQWYQIYGTTTWYHFVPLRFSYPERKPLMYHACNCQAWSGTRRSSRILATPKPAAAPTPAGEAYFSECHIACLEWSRLQVLVPGGSWPY